MTALPMSAVVPGGRSLTPADRTRSIQFGSDRVILLSVKDLPDGLPVTFTTGTALGLGVHQRDLYRWRDDAEIIELARGVFRRSDAALASYPDELAVSCRAPRAVVCCLSAAAIHDLTDEIPRQVQIAVADGDTPPRITYPPVQVFRFTPATFQLGVTTFEAAPRERVRIYDAARTVVDLIRMRKRFGEPIAYGALNRFLDRPGADVRQVRVYADLLHVAGPTQLALDITRAR